MRRPLALLGLLGLLAAVATVVAVSSGFGAAEGRAVQARVGSIRIATRLPAWLAPGGRFAVGGFAGSRQPVVVSSDGRRIASGRSGPLGRFLIRVRAPAAGRHRLALRAGDLRVRLGAVVIRPIELAAVGDVTPGEAVGPTVASAGPAYPWGSVGGVLQRADLATANLEGAVSTGGTGVPGKEYHFRGPHELLTGARRYGGIDVFTLANNHVMDYGAVALRDTIESARRAGIATVGAGGTVTAARRPAFFDVGGLTVAFLGYSDVNPLGFVATATAPGTAPADVAAITADVRAARSRADLVVCWFHWGVELHASPDSRQQLFAAAALNAGARLVLGAHPHVLGGFARTGRSLVAWTLGNFVFPSSSPGTVRTGILLVRLDATGVRGFRLVPATAGVRPVLG